MASTSSFAISPFSLLGSNTPTIQSTTLILAGTEYSYALPVNTGTFLIQVRSGGSVTFGYAPGSSLTTNSLEIGVKGFFSRENILNTASYTLYFRSLVAGTIIVVESWKTS